MRSTVVFAKYTPISGIGKRTSRRAPLAPYFKVDGKASGLPHKWVFISQCFALPSARSSANIEIRGTGGSFRIFNGRAFISQTADSFARGVCRMGDAVWLVSYDAFESNDSMVLALVTYGWWSAARAL